VTAAILSRTGTGEHEQGLRPVNPRRDMASVGRLIETSFAGDLDSVGRQMVREMKAFGRAGWLGWLAGRLFLPPAAFPLGYVWQEEGRLVGNASLLPIGRGFNRWVLANVAVAPDHRRRGIARRMVRACLDLAAHRGVGEVVLQVRSDNEAAISLYRHLGFGVLTTRTEWLRSNGERPAPGPGFVVRRRREGEWRLQWLQAQRLYPEGLYWPYPLNNAWFRPDGWLAFLSPAPARHWVVANPDGGLAGSISARFSQDSRGWRLALLTAPDQTNLAEALVRHALAALQSRGLPARLSYPVGQLDAPLQALGFRAKRTLAWMGVDVGDEVPRG
jgi:ribosomal protein S18 acetylase RimI-like enzyme